MTPINIIPDSSFYLCFLDDINKPDYLNKILLHDNFNFLTAYIIKEEIGRSSNINPITKNIETQFTVFDYRQYGEIFRVFLSESEITKGEHEVIIISYILNFFNKPFISIIDEVSKKKFLLNLIPEKKSDIMGTVGFIAYCTCKCNIFIKGDAIYLLNCIKSSKFFINPLIVDKIKIIINEC